MDGKCLGLFLLTALCKHQSSTVGPGTRGGLWEGGHSGCQDHLGEARSGPGWLVRGKVRVGLLHSELGQEAPAGDFWVSVSRGVDGG